MTPLVTLAALAFAAPPSAAPPGGGWKFVDETSLNGRSLATFRTVELLDKPAKPPHADDAPPAGARFGDVPLGPRAAARLPVVWHAATGALWVDADADGRFAPGERHTLTTKPVELVVSVPDGPGVKLSRTLLVRRRGDGLAHAVRGYRAGPLVLGGETFPALLTDGNADGHFADPAADRLWVDTNRDGKFDPLTEQFPLGRPVAVGGAAYLVRPDPAGTVTATARRATDTGELILDVARQRGATVAAFQAHLVSEWGELVIVDAAETAQAVPAGRYRIDGVKLHLLDADGRTWAYEFGGPDGYSFTVEKGRTTVADLTAGAKATISLSQASAAAGALIEVAPDVVTGRGLTLRSCERLEKFSDYGQRQEARIALEEPGSVAVAECRSGFS